MSKIYVDEIAGIASPSTVAIPGHVIQVVQTSTNTQVSTGSSAWTDSGLTLDITPSSTSSKILILGNPTVNVFQDGVGAQDAFSKIRLLKDGSTDLTGDLYVRSYDYDGTGGMNQAPIMISYLDSPSSTSSVNYKVQIWVDSGTGRISQSGQYSYITAMEIAG